ncbi:extracellular solute-binding protein [Paenibacillus dendritiformis]|uniref:ABC transporter substrate-binding protein n=1 Tax=Paenibacillus dendritiformis TaxID=130049 RepID=UPI00248AFC97|nr:extracellular solute-binding protein [Paenibacillus dendritiformis]WGU92747.1 extracellular solute-binding protein [Paenibacillus dendritiformis]
MRLSRKWKMTGLLLSIAILLNGCMAGKPVQDELGEDATGSLKIWYPDVEPFHTKYGQMFAAKFPGIQVDVLQAREWIEEARQGDYEEELKRLIELHKPDVLLLDQDEYEALAQAGKLYNLDPAIMQDQFDLSGYMPGMIDMLREKGDGSLYGLAPFIRPRVMYYNADLFKENSIDPPSNKMQWPDMFALAARFPNTGTEDAPVYGLIGNEAHDVLSQVALTLDLQLFDAKGENVVLQSEGWKQAFQIAAEAIRSKAISVRSPKEAGEGPEGYGYFLAINKFLNGEAAMLISDHHFASQLRSKAKTFDWGMVTVPINPARPDESTSVYVPQILAIAADSPRKQAAWNLIRFINGPEVAKARSRTAGSDLPAIADYVSGGDRADTEVFYMLKPAAQHNERVMKRVPDSFYQAYSSLVNEALQSVIDNVKPVDEALAELEQKAQAMLESARSKAQEEHQGR